MSKILKLGIIGVLVGCMVGCGAQVDNNSTSDQASTTAQTQEETNDGGEGNTENVAEEELPFGSVVLLKDSNKRIMIYGHKQQISGDAENKIWDYAACYYPEGRLDADSTFLFNTDQIDRVDFTGLKSLDEASLSSEVGEKWLPVGSVVEVTGANEPVLVIGRYQKSAETGELYDYIGCSYEKGNVSADDTWIFNHDMVTGIYFRGFEDEEESEFQEKLNSLK